jgi:hypothetical protein
MGCILVGEALQFRNLSHHSYTLVPAMGPILLAYLRYLRRRSCLPFLGMHTELTIAAQ